MRAASSSSVASPAGRSLSAARSAACSPRRCSRLQAQGWIVEVYGRSPHELESSSGGLVLQPEVLEAFRQAGIEHDVSIGVTAHERIFLAHDGAIAHRSPVGQTQTSWSSLYSALRRRLSRDR